MANKKKRPDVLSAPAQTDVKLTTTQIEVMLAHVLRLSNLFTIAKSQMPPKVFSEQTELVYRKLWEAALAIEDEIGTKYFHNKPADIEFRMWNYIAPRLEEDKEFPSTMKDYILNPNGLLHAIFARAQFVEDEAYKLLKRFLRERLVQLPLWKKLTNAGGILLDDLPTILQSAQRLDTSISALDADPVESGAPTGWVPAKLSKFPTGIPFMDKFLNGGNAPGEVYGVLGAFASGKTSLAVQLLYNAAMQHQLYAAERNDAEPEDSGVIYYPKECYIFTYEATADEIRMRLWSSACTIHHDVLEEFDWSKLSTNAKGYDGLKPYEQRYFQDWKKAGHKDQIQGEKERLESKIPLFNRNLWVLDMSGTGDNPKRGTGYVSEIRQIIDADLERKSRKSGRRHEVGSIVIDYAGLASWRYIAEHGVEASELRHYIGRFGDACKKELAVPLQCPVWLFHQLTGEANKRTHKVQQHYTDAAESKAFAENLAFCFALGTKDEETNTLLLTCSKARRAQIGHPPTLVLEGEFFRLAESKQFMYDPKTRSFVPKTELKEPSAAPPAEEVVGELPSKPLNAVVG